MRAEDVVVDFCGELHRLNGEARLTFGRRADLEIDDNPFLHRVLGEIVTVGGAGSVRNLGRSIVIEIHDAVTLSHVVLAPGASAPLPFGTNIVRFVAGATAYEFVVRVPSHEPLTEDGNALVANGTMTMTHLPLTPSQRELIAMLAEPRLLNPTDRQAPMPTNREVANRLGWELTKLNRKLDSICAKLARHGVKGLHGGIDALATDRRRRLVDYAITTGLVTLADLNPAPGDVD